MAKTAGQVSLLARHLFRNYLRMSLGDARMHPVAMPIDLMPTLADDVSEQRHSAGVVYACRLQITGRQPGGNQEPRAVHHAWVSSR
jgi:hypothetical protein